MKYAKVILCVLLICVMLSGCSFRMASSIDDLISPISPLGDNADIQSAMDSYAKNGYSLKTPNDGDYISSYNFYDIDGDSQDEAFAFYEPSDNLGTIDMAVIKKIDGKWQVVDNINGDGKDIHSIAFNDVTGDKKDDILICWDVISNSSNHELSVYQYDEKDNSISLKRIDNSITVNNFICVDIDENGVDELLLFEINTGNSSSAKSELYSLKDNKFKLLGETKLDSHITAYSKLRIEKAENDVRIYADAIGSDGSSMLTEVIYWSNGYDTIISPFYSYSTGRTKDTSRSAMIESRDINDDGLIEIPTDKNLSKLPSEVCAVDWKIYKKTTLIHTDYSLLVKNDGYFVIVPDNYINNIRVKYNSDKRLMTVYDKSGKRKIFEIMPVLKATYSDSNYGGYDIVKENSGYYYLAKCSKDTDIKITIDDLKNYIKSID
ncbi:MAG: hypothetical protein ACLUFN_09655 [Eubacterium sp.]